MRWLVFSNAYVALSGAALTAATYALLGQAPRLDAVVALVFFSTLVIYNLDRLVEPRPGDSTHERWIDQHRKPLWVITLVAAVGSALCATQLSTAALLSLLPASAIAVGYCLPVLRYRKRWHRLKQVPGAKLLLIAIVWTYATAALPILDRGIEIDSHGIAVLIARLLFITAVALPFDVPDMQRDRQSGIKTLPTLLGVQTTRRIAITLAMAGAIVGVFNPWPAAGAVVLSSLAAVVLILGLKADRGVLYFMVALDGMLLIQAGALWISTGL